MTRVFEFAARTVPIALALMLLEWVFGLVFPGLAATDDSRSAVARYVLPFVSAYVLAAAFAYPISRSRLGGHALLGAAFLATFGLTTVLSQIESALFLDMTAEELWLGVLELTLASALLSWLAVSLYPKVQRESAGGRQTPNPPSTASWVRRWIGVSVAYVVLYVTAGMLILPRIQAWYEEQGLLDIDPALVLPLQVVRGALYVAFVLPLLRSMRVARWQAALAMAVMIPLVHGVAPLMSPNPFMPDYVRHAHMIEIGWSNFVLGLLIGFLFWNPRPSGEQEREP